MPVIVPDDAQQRLRDTAAEFIRVRGALQQAATLAVVNASPVAKARLAALNKRAGVIQDAITNAGKMVDGARRWFSDTFGTEVEDAVPLANPAIAASIQTSIAGMNYFLKDARSELDAIIARQKKYEALPADQKDAVLNGLHAEAATDTVTPAVPAKWLWIGAGVLAVWVFLKGKGDDDET